VQQATPEPAPSHQEFDYAINIMIVHEGEVKTKVVLDPTTIAILSAIHELCVPLNLPSLGFRGLAPTDDKDVWGAPTNGQPFRVTEALMFKDPGPNLIDSMPWNPSTPAPPAPPATEGRQPVEINIIDQRGQWALNLSDRSKVFEGIRVALDSLKLENRVATSVTLTGKYRYQTTLESRA
jgi:hypothetical protein